MWAEKKKRLAGEREGEKIFFRKREAAGGLRGKGAEEKTERRTEERERGREEEREREERERERASRACMLRFRAATGR